MDYYLNDQQIEELVNFDHIEDLADLVEGDSPWVWLAWVLGRLEHAHRSPSVYRGSGGPGAANGVEKL